ncbi:MAG: glycosyltransferase family 2 protein [Acidobacteria bacterium]|nr:glycosyltransferase family 2 protein [Acidobacteriota bacterium]
MDIYPQSEDQRPGFAVFPIGIVIPTYNRSDTILMCLEHLERQTWADFEVIIVDDGSTDSTPKLLERYLDSTRLHVRYIRQENAGAARARNVAASVMQAPVCLMIGDDIFASPDLVRTHLTLHQQRPELNIACLGLTQWSESGQLVTKFMRWLDESGNQFAYGDLLRGTRADWRHFYTSNLSVKTEFLRQNPFNEGFSKYGMEDIELGYRMQIQHGLEIAFLPKALAHHLHPTSFRRACSRQVLVGKSNRLFHDMWPECMPKSTSPLRRTFRRFISHNEWLISPLTSAADVLTRIWCPNPLMYAALSANYSVGYENSPYRSLRTGVPSDVDHAASSRKSASQ